MESPHSLRYEGQRGSLLPPVVYLALAFGLGCGDAIGPAGDLPLTVLAVYDLGTYPGTDKSVANAVNADGWIVGWSAVSTVLRPVIWSPDRAIALVDTTTHCTAVDINRSRWVVGQCFDNTAVLWRSPNERTKLDTVAAPSGGALAINEFGQAAGSAVRCSGCGILSAVAWEADGTPRYLDPRPGDGASSGADISASGEVVGVSFAYPVSPTDPPLTLAVMWRGSDLVELGALRGFPASEAIAVNDRGVVVGKSCAPTCGLSTLTTRGFLWEDGSLTDLGNRRPLAINNHGVVVGNGAGGPFVWADGRLAELESLPGTTGCFVHDISDAGHVVGACVVEGGLLHATLWVINTDP